MGASENWLGVTTTVNKVIFLGLSVLFVSQIEVENLSVFHESLWAGPNIEGLGQTANEFIPAVA